MSTNKYALFSKKGAFILFLTLTASSLFAFVLPAYISFSPEPAKEETMALPFGPHPLIGSSDAVVVCANDNSELHEIYLCGASAERLINTNIPNLQSITWARLSDTQTNCSATTNCPSNSPGCNWDDLSTDTQFNVVQGGEYRILVRYTDNTTERFYFNVYTNGLNPSPVVTNIDCGSPGSITVNNVPSTYEYSINNGATWQSSNVFSITSVSTYDILIRRQNDTTGCLFTLDDIAVNNNAIDATATILPISCNSALGAIQVDISNASSTYVYEISQGGSLINSSGPISNSSYTFADLNAGTYDINVTLASVSACSWVSQQTVPPFVNVQPDAVVTKNIDCTDGVITVTKTAGAAPFEYSLNGSTTFTPFTSGDQTTIPIATAGTYTVNVRDMSGCEIEAPQVTVVDQPEITYTVTPQDITCNGTDDGSITINVSDTQGYSISYSIDGGTSFQTSNVFSNLAANTYSIIIRKQKAGGVCDLAPTTHVVGQSPAFTAGASVTQQIDCTNGQATIEATIAAGGTAPFEYSLDGSTFQPSSTFTGLGPGNYTITVRDSSGCTTTVDQTVNAGSNPSDLTFLTSSVDCATGATDVQVTVQNGNAPFTYAITSPTTINAGGDTFTALAPNTYTFEVTADDGCKIVRNFVVPDPIQFTSNALVKTNVSCATGTSDGSIELSVENFNTSYTVVVEDGTGTPLGLGLNTQTASPLLIPGLAADTYTLRINDESGPCQKVETLTIAAPATALTIDSFAVGNMNCGAPGSVTIEASGGWSNYRYSVEQPDGISTSLQSNKTITGLTQAGIHIITVVDANGCALNTETFDLVDQGGPVSVVDQVASSYCYSVATPGELKIDVTDNGTAPYFYTVNDGTPMLITGGTFTLSNLTPATYEVKVKGNNGCETIVADTNISGQLFAFANITKPLGCGTPPDAEIVITPENGYPPFTYEVDNGTGYVPATMPFSTNTDGTFIFKIIDAKGCEFYIGDPRVASGTVNGTEQPVEVTRSPDIIPAATIQPTACGKAGTGSITLAAGGGTPPFEYAFSTAPFDPVSNAPVFSTRTIYNNLDATSYYYLVRDALGCVSAEQVEILGAESAIEAMIEKTDISCDPVAGGNVWGNVKVSNIINSTGPVTISLIRVQDPVAYAAGNETRTWTYRRYQNIDLATNSNYNSASVPARYGTTTGFDIRMYWALDFVVQIEDERGCSWESQPFNITSPPIPSIVNSDPVDQTCANGATYDFSINNVDSDGDGTPDLVGPFDVRLYPYQLVDADGDGVEDDVTSGWRPFNDISNPAWDGVAGTAGNPNERDYRFTNGEAFGYNKLLFGVAYSVAIRDNNTGCIRWRALRPIVQPPAGFITVDVVPQSETCRNAADGEIEFTINNYAPGIVNYTIYNAGNPAHTGFQFSGTATGTGAPLTINIQNMRRAWYVVEVEDSSGCQAGERFLVYTPRTALKLEEDQVVQPTCHTGGQVAVTATGGWDDERYFNIRNKLRQNWHPYEYAFVLDSQTPADSDFGPDSIWTNIVPTAYDGNNNVYRAYIRDGGGCMVALPNPITFIEAPRPEIDAVNVTNRCTSTNEIYNVVATLTNPGTNPVEGAPKFIWDGQVTSSSTAQLGPGNHTLEVRDENGCSVSQNVFIYPQMAAPSARITQNEQCAPANSGAVAIDVYGGSLDYTYEMIVGGTVVESHVSADPNAELFTGLTHSIVYTFRVTDNLSGCGFRETNITLDQPVLPEFEGEAVQHISCNGADDGIIRIVQQPGSTNLDIPYEYSLDGVTYQTSNLFTGLAPGTYSNINVRSSKNCIQSIPDVEIFDSPLLAVGGTSVSIFTCTADNNLGMATITVNITGGTGVGTYQYSYDGGSYTTSNTYDIPFLATARTIPVDVIDANNCVVATTVTIPAATKISATISTTTAMSCVTDGVYEINIDPSFTNINVVQLPGASATVAMSGARNTTVTILAGNPDTYSFLITDNDTGCTAKVTQVVSPFDTIDVSASHGSDIVCHGASDGTLNFTATGFGASGFDYVVYRADNTVEQAAVNSSSMTAVTVSGLPAGTFYIEVIDVATGCTEESEIISIQSPVEPLDFNIATTQVLTCIGADAQITLTPNGGWGDYEFEVVETISGNVTQAFDGNNVIDGLIGISYDVRVSDSRGCVSPIKSVSITPIDPIIIDETTDIMVSEPTCPGSNDGTIIVSFSRTNGPSNYEYILTNLTTGVSMLPQNGTSPFTFSNLFAGSYAVTVQDNLNCSDITDLPITLTDPFVLEIGGEITQEPTCTPNSGEITVSASGNLGDTFEYQMIRPITHPSAGSWLPSGVYGNLGPDTYEFVARNQFGCETPIAVIRTINVVDPLVVVIDDSNTTINCFGDDDAVLVAEASGGLGGYMYQLELNGTLIGTPQPSGIFENLGAGTYDIQATSGPDCVALNSQKIIIADPAELIVPPTVTATPIACFGDSTGSVTIPATGEAPFSFYLSTEPQKAYSSGTFENLAVGSYTVIVQDVNGCERTTSFTVTGPSEALATQIVRVVDEVCSSDDNGLIEIAITGGTSPYSYTVGDNQGTYSSVSGGTLLLDNLDGGFYEIFVKDANDCAAEMIFQEVKVGSDLSATIETGSECNEGQPNYTASVIFDDETLDTSEIVYDLDDTNPNNPDVNNSQSNGDFPNITPGDHTISIVHLGTGCVEVKTFNIEAQEPLTLTSIDGEINQILVEASGGDGSYTYYFEDEVNSTGSYYINQDFNSTVRVVDGKGCEASIDIALEFIDIEIPNFFTPDGDGYKDTWVIKNSEGFPNMQVRLYDRYGRTIKEWIGQGEWDGSYNKSDLPTGDYWYVLKLNGPRDSREFVGHVTVYR